jgi:hypothetical protein
MGTTILSNKSNIIRGFMDLYLYKFLIRENMALVALSVKALDADLNDPDFENIIPK